MELERLGFNAVPSSSASDIIVHAEFVCTPGAAANQVDFSETGVAKALAHWQEGPVSEELSSGEYLSTARDIANDPLYALPNEGGGTRAYGIINYLGDRLEPQVMRVVVGRTGEIIDAFVDKGATSFVFGPSLRSLLLAGYLG